MLLENEFFTTAWQEYKSKKYEAIITVNDFHLLQHDGKKWSVINSVFLSLVIDNTHDHVNSNFHTGL